MEQRVYEHFYNDLENFVFLPIYLHFFAEMKYSQVYFGPFSSISDSVRPVKNSSIVFAACGHMKTANIAL